MKKKFDFNDISIVPEVLSIVDSRNEIDITDENGRLPIFVAPMDTVVNQTNYRKFLDLGINVCLPRGVMSYNEDLFISMSLDAFESFIEDYIEDWYMFEKLNILVDIANGHMLKLYQLCEKFISIRKSDSHKIMIGNIANPRTYMEYALLGVDYIRVGIGGGSGCLTSANTGVHYPMASLVSECYELKEKHNFKTKIVADGGFKKFDDIIKALCLGADYVMIGGLFNQSLESCGDNYLFGKIKLSQNVAEKIWNEFPKLRKYMSKSFRGMSTKDVQKKWGKNVLRTSEGISKRNLIKYKLEGWVDNFSDYLKSSMSYTSSRNLEDFKNSFYTLITNNSYNRFNK